MVSPSGHHKLRNGTLGGVTLYTYKEKLERRVFTWGCLLPFFKAYIKSPKVVSTSYQKDFTNRKPKHESASTW